MKKALLVILSMTLIACNTMVSLGDTIVNYGKGSVSSEYDWTFKGSVDDTVENNKDDICCNITFLRY
mgnify:CR=1 FL=1